MAGAAQNIHVDVAVGMTTDEFVNVGRLPDGGKCELVNGQLRAQSPASDAHGIIKANRAGLISAHLSSIGGPCRALTEPTRCAGDGCYGRLDCNPVGWEQGRDLG